MCKLLHTQSNFMTTSDIFSAVCNNNRLFCKSLKYMNLKSDNELLRCAQSSKKTWMFTFNSHWRLSMYLIIFYINIILFCFLPLSTCPVVFCFYTIVEAPCFVIILFHFLDVLYYWNRIYIFSFRLCLYSLLKKPEVHFQTI